MDDFIYFKANIKGEKKHNNCINKPKSKPITSSNDLPFVFHRF